VSSTLRQRCKGNDVAVVCGGGEVEVRLKECEKVVDSNVDLLKFIFPPCLTYLAGKNFADRTREAAVY
jgi:hypothetical protein